MARPTSEAEYIADTLNYRMVEEISQWLRSGLKLRLSEDEQKTLTATADGLDKILSWQS